jgi:tetratricopeptide (TPR) repeat protein
VLKSWGQSWLIYGVLALLSGCAGNVGNMVAELEGHHTAIELTNVPFHSQVTDQCGPAALAALLNDAGVPVGPEILKTRVYIPERQGSLQLELMAATRHFGRIPYEIDPNLSALVAELEAGRPVLILQNLGVSVAPVWHYAVVVGYLANEQQFVLRSGDKERLLLKAKSFTRSWKRGNFWAIVALEPGELPARAVAERYLRAVAAIESTGDAENAILAYQAATERWPESRLAWLGLGNASYAQGELLKAEIAYRKVLGIMPADAIALNNLSQVYLELGCRDDALATIDSALSGVGATDPIRSHLLLTQQEANRSDARSRCL